MIDLHSHILPEVDDGAPDLYRALDMARVAVQSGVTAMVVTPHCADGRAEEVLSTLRLLRSALRESGIRLQLFPGMEIYGTRDTVPLLREGKLLTLNGSRYPLVEFSFRADGSRQTQILSELLRAGYRPVVAHPERYSYVQSNPELLNLWVKMGCLLQVNKGSLLGSFGRDCQSLALETVDRGLAAVVASDAHSPIRRTPRMEDVWKLLEERFAPQAAQMLLRENPRRIINDEMIPPVEPEWF